LPLFGVSVSVATGSHPRLYVDWTSSPENEVEALSKDLSEELVSAGVGKVSWMTSDMKI
jgi:hypothetical protein